MRAQQKEEPEIAVSLNRACRFLGCLVLSWLLVAQVEQLMREAGAERARGEEAAAALSQLHTRTLAEQATVHSERGTCPSSAFTLRSISAAFCVVVCLCESWMHTHLIQS